MIFPEILKEFESNLKSYKLDSVKIIAKPIQDGKKLSITSSKFLGKPYLPLSFE